MIVVTHIKKFNLKIYLDLHFKVKLRPKSLKNGLIFKIFFSRTISARTEQKAVSKSL
jgi:hypothetical protein